jgi:hypothetical protein
VLSHDQLLTDPDQAFGFVVRTKVDALAVAIGTSHGAYKFNQRTRGCPRGRRASPRLSFLQSTNGSRTRIVSSRSGLVESSATGHSTSSSRRLTYLTALAGSWAKLRAPLVVSSQPSSSS